MAGAPLALQVISMVLAAEPAIVQAVHNLLAGTGGIDDLAILKGDAIEWQAIADKAAAELAKTAPPPITQ